MQGFASEVAPAHRVCAGNEEAKPWQFEEVWTVDTLLRLLRLALKMHNNKQPWEKPMDWNLKKLGSTVALTMVGLGSTGFAAANTSNTRNMAVDQCAPTPAAPCYSVDTPMCDYCLGPETVAGNPAVNPKTCNGDLVLTIAGFYWNMHQDGMEFAVDNSVPLPAMAGDDASALVNLVDAEYLTPHSKWDFGFKLGLGYNGTHDGWDFGVVWTHFKGRASNDVEEETTDNSSLLPLWSDFASGSAFPTLFASSMEASWNVDLDLVDFELGREFWASKYLTLRPHVGLRLSWIGQDFDIEHKGGSWGGGIAGSIATNNLVDMDNDFKGVGVRGGLNSVWNFGRGFALFGNVALSIIYGRFSIDQDEDNRFTTAPFAKTTILETINSYHSSKAMTDLELGIQWSTMFSNCNYGFTIGLSWEHHMFFNQNHLWRVNHIPLPNVPPAPAGPNTFIPANGDLSTQGWTLKATFDF